MPSYYFIDKAGQRQTIDAPDPNTAIANAPNRDPSSGVQLYTPTTPTAPVPIPKTVTTTLTPTIDRTPAIGTLQRANEAASDQASVRADIQRQVDEEKARNRQARIDVINAGFQPRIDRERQAGTERDARVLNLMASKGLIGSGAETTSISEQKGLNEKALQGIEAEKALQIQSAFDYVDQLALDRAKLLTEQAQGDADAKVKLLQGQTDKAIEAIQMFGKNGNMFSIEDLEKADPNTLKTLREVSGYSDAQILQVLDAAKPQPTNIDTKIENGYLVATYYDPVSKQFKATTQKLDLPQVTDPKNIEIVSAKNGLLYVIDKMTGNKINVIGERDPSYGLDGEDPLVTSELQQAQAAIGAGANPDDVRRMFLDKYPKKGDLFLKYTKQQY